MIAYKLNQQADRTLGPGYVVMVVTHEGGLPSAEKMVSAGVPVVVARNYKRIRREMTSGLRKRAREAVN